MRTTTVTGQKKRTGLVDKLRRQLHETEKRVAFYAGEGRKDRPDMIEWQRLANKKKRTAAETKRMGRIAQAVLHEDLDAPERLAEIKALRRMAGRLLEIANDPNRYAWDRLAKIQRLLSEHAPKSDSGSEFPKTPPVEAHPEDKEGEQEQQSLGEL